MESVELESQLFGQWTEVIPDKDFSFELSYLDGIHLEEHSGIIRHHCLTEARKGKGEVSH